jgi:hypothetical protein
VDLVRLILDLLSLGAWDVPWQTSGRWSETYNDLLVLVSVQLC